MNNPDRDGCTCPPWVIRCVHFGSHVLRLVGPDAEHDGHERDTGNAIASHVLGFNLGPCVCGAPYFHAKMGTGDQWFFTTESALAAFYAAEEGLVTHA